MMKTKLLVTVAMAALITGSAGALAQEEHGGGGAAGPGAAQHQMSPGGAGAGSATQHGQAPGTSAQTQVKPQSGAGEQKSVQGGADEHGNGAMQRGAQQEPGKAGGSAQEHAQTQGGKGESAQEHAQTQGGKGDRNAEERSKQDNAQSQDRSKQENAQSQDRSKQENAQTQERNRTQENAQDKTQERGNQNAQGTTQERGNQQNAQGRAAGGKTVQLTETQRTQIKNVVIKDRNVARVDHVDFSVNVGVAVPRSIHVATLPADIVEVVPEYRGFDYVVVGDRLLIIDPNTMLVVDILPV